MKIPTLPFTVTDRAEVPQPSISAGRDKQIAHVHDRRFACAPSRISAGYISDHWCDLGHVLYVLEGELDTELRDGRTFKLRPGMSYQVSDHGDAAHRSSTQTGAKLFIVD
jgi:hypothetical protein